MAKIRLTRKLRPLLEELDSAFSLAMEQTRILSEPGIDSNTAVDIAAEREYQRRRIYNIAGQINLVSTGQK